MDFMHILIFTRTIGSRAVCSLTNQIQVSEMICTITFFFFLITFT